MLRIDRCLIYTGEIQDFKFCLYRIVLFRSLFRQGSLCNVSESECSFFDEIMTSVYYKRNMMS